MTLDIDLDAKPATVHAFAQWLREPAGRASDAALAATRSRNVSAGGWDGDAGEAFRETAGAMSSEAHALSGMFRDMGATADAYANDMDVVRDKLANAADLGRQGGLVVTNTVIKDPGSPPPKPELRSYQGYEAMPPPGSAAREQWVAWTEWNRKVQVYAECAVLVAEARAYELKSQESAAETLRKLAEGAPVSVSSVLVGVADAYLVRQRYWRTTASSLRETALYHLRHFKDGTLSPEVRVAHLAREADAFVKAAHLQRQADATKIGRYLERLPGPAKRALTAKISQAIPKGAPYLTNAPLAFRKIPVIGAAITAVGAVTDIASGKDPATTVLATSSGLAAGTASGMAIGSVFGGIPGAIVGGIVGTGTTVAVERYSDSWGSGEATLDAYRQLGPVAGTVIAMLEGSTHAMGEARNHMTGPDVVIAPGDPSPPEVQGDSRSQPRGPV